MRFLGRTKLHRTRQVWTKKDNKSSFPSDLTNFENASFHWSAHHSHRKQLGPVYHPDYDANLHEQHSTHFSQNSKSAYTLINVVPNCIFKNQK